MTNRRNFDYLFNGRFKIKIEGVTQDAFVQCEGLRARVDMVRYDDGSDLTTRKWPLRHSVSRIVLRERLAEQRRVVGVGEHSRG